MRIKVSVLQAMLNLTDVSSRVKYLLLNGKDVLATDGKVGGIYSIDSENTFPEISIYLDIVKLVIRKAALMRIREVEITPDEIILSHNEKVPFNRVTSLVINMSNFMAVVPKSVSGTVAQFDPDLLVRFKKTYCQLLESKSKMHYPVIRHNGDDPAVVEFPKLKEKFVGIIQPLHLSEV